jgi:chloramphenicol-sensitive protein RarD
MNTDARSTEGVLYGLAAYFLWGVVPLYFHALSVLAHESISAEEILAHRIVWSVAFLVLLLTLTRRWPVVLRCFRSRGLLLTLLVTTVLIGLNWYVYIFGVVTEQVLETSLGYFINPLASVAMGMVFFRERMRPLQWAALVLAAAGVVGMTLLVGRLPWIALSLAGLFSVYGLLRKQAPVDGLAGLSVETFLLAPLAAAYLLLLVGEGRAAVGVYGPACDAMIVASGAVTALPLMCFGQAARRLRLSTLGFLQYLAPSLQFVCAVAILHEPISEEKLACFAAIWAGLAVFTVDSVWTRLRFRAVQRETMNDAATS